MKAIYIYWYTNLQQLWNYIQVTVLLRLCIITRNKETLLVSQMLEVRTFWSLLGPNLCSSLFPDRHGKDTTLSTPPRGISQLGRDELVFFFSPLINVEVEYHIEKRSKVTTKSLSFTRIQRDVRRRRRTLRETKATTLILETRHHQDNEKY